MTVNELYKYCKEQIDKGLGDCEIDNTKTYLLFIIGYDFTKELEAECSRRQGIDDAPCDLAFEIAQEIIKEYNDLLENELLEDMTYNKTYEKTDEDDDDFANFSWNYERFYDFVQGYFEIRSDV